MDAIVLGVAILFFTGFVVLNFFPMTIENKTVEKVIVRIIIGLTILAVGLVACGAAYMLFYYACMAN